MKKLLEKVVKMIVDQPRSVKVEESTSPEGATLFRLTVAQEDMGKVIGKGGKIAKALRLMLRVPALREGKRISLEIVEIS